MSRKTGGNGHGPDEPDEKGIEAVRRGADRAWEIHQARLAEERRKAEEKARRKQEAADRRAKAQEARIKARIERAEQRKLAKAQRKLRQKYKGNPPGNGK